MPARGNSPGVHDVYTQFRVDVRVRAYMSERIVFASSVHAPLILDTLKHSIDVNLWFRFDAQFLRKFEEIISLSFFRFLKIIGSLYINLCISFNYFFNVIIYFSKLINNWNWDVMCILIYHLDFEINADKNEYIMIHNFKLLYIKIQNIVFI